jgi:phosphate butyryltransferase
MEPIRTFGQLTAHLKSLRTRKRVVVVCADDEHTQYAVQRALREGIADVIFVGDENKLSKYPELDDYAEHIQKVHIEDSDEAAAEAVRIVRRGEADILMKGIINTDNLLHTILNKEEGLLPKGKVLTHLAVMQIPSYHKLLFFSDAAVIPVPTIYQRIEMIWYAIHTCHHFGIERPKISLIHCTEKVSSKFPISLDYVNLVELCEAGEFGNAIIDGPLDVRTSCESASGNIKGIVSPINGDADVLIFPNLESSNCFYKAVALFAHAEMAGMLQGPMCPVVLPSRSDSGISKYYSLTMACLSANSKSNVL